LVAIKILEKSRIKESADLERIKREIEILKEIKHENIVELFEIVEN
jgi:5'-AMP-activated protein kinase catalytic alpha subunit